MNLDGGWRKGVRNKRFVVTGSLILSALVGLLIPVFAGSLVYGAKLIVESTTKRIVAAERQSRKKEREDNWNVNILKNITEKLADSIDLLQTRVTLNGEIQLLERESRDIMSRSIWLHKKGDFQWDPRDPLRRSSLK